MRIASAKNSLPSSKNPVMKDQLTKLFEAHPMPAELALDKAIQSGARLGAYNAEASTRTQGKTIRKIKESLLTRNSSSISPSNSPSGSASGAKAKLSEAANIADYGPRYVPPQRQSNPFSIRGHHFGPGVIEDETEALPREEETSAAAAEAQKQIENQIDSQIENQIGNGAVLESGESVSAAPAVAAGISSPSREVLEAVAPAAVPVALATSDAGPIGLGAAGASLSPAQFQQPGLPPSLAWLEKPSPFSVNLNAIVESLRDARTRANFTLGEHLARAKEYRGRLEAEEFGIETQRENLKVLDDTISACALVAEQSLGIEPALLSTGHAKVASAPREHRYHRPATNDPSILRIKDVSKFFENNRETNWTVAEILPLLPAAKRQHAKSYLPNVLSTLCDAKEILRVSRGIYRASSEAHGAGTNGDGVKI
jgi:hypothetical protein